MLQLLGEISDSSARPKTPLHQRPPGKRTPRSRTRSCHSTAFDLTTIMSLVSGPGRGGVKSLPTEMHLVVDKHVRYIQTLDSVRDL